MYKCRGVSNITVTRPRRAGGVAARSMLSGEPNIACKNHVFFKGPCPHVRASSRVCGSSQAGTELHGTLPSSKSERWEVARKPILAARAFRVVSETQKTDVEKQMQAGEAAWRETYHVGLRLAVMALGGEATLAVALSGRGLQVGRNRARCHCVYV